jgi:hypothetical protein
VKCVRWVVSTVHNSSRVLVVLSRFVFLSLLFCYYNSTISNLTHFTPQPVPLVPSTPHSSLGSNGSVVVEAIGVVESLFSGAGEVVKSNELGMYPRSNLESENMPCEKQNQKSALSFQTKSTETIGKQNFQNQKLEQRDRVNFEQQTPKTTTNRHGQLQSKFSNAQTKNQGTLGPYEEHSNVPSAHEASASDPGPVPNSGAALNVDLGSETELDSPTRMIKENRKEEEEDQGDKSVSLEFSLSFS